MSVKQKIQRFSCSEKNNDIYTLLEDKKKDSRFNASDYICEAIRFYEENKNKKQDINFDEIQKFIDDKLEKFKREILQGNVMFDSKISENELLESGLDKISVEELEDD